MLLPLCVISLSLALWLVTNQKRPRGLFGFLLEKAIIPGLFFSGIILLLLYFLKS